MQSWQEESLHRLMQMDSTDDLFSEVQKIAYSLEFEFCAYGMRFPLPVTRPRVFMVNNYPEAWQKTYLEKEYVKIDPSVAQTLKSMRPVIWSEELFSSSKAFWEEAQSHGLAVGWAQSCRDCRGAFGMLTLARSGEPLSSAEFHSKELKMLWLAQLTHIGLSRTAVESMKSYAEIKLSARETEVLRWTAEGKTSSEIASIIQISERTVNFHINNSLKKMNCRNKTAASIQAAVLGYL